MVSRVFPSGWTRKTHLQDADATHAGGQTGIRKKCRAGLLAPQGAYGLIGYAAFFFAALAGTFVGGLGAAFFAALAFSFSANSALTLLVIAATSTL
jgi:hypothetical protein